MLNDGEPPEDRLDEDYIHLGWDLLKPIVQRTTLTGDSDVATSQARCTSDRTSASPLTSLALFVAIYFCTVASLSKAETLRNKKVTVAPESVVDVNFREAGRS
jgi:hypothetical protein